VKDERSGATRGVKVRGMSFSKRPAQGPAASMRTRCRPLTGLPVVADFRLRARTRIVTASLGDEGQVELATWSRGNAWVNCRPARSVAAPQPVAWPQA
jgi:hypothetical protein